MTASATARLGLMVAPTRGLEPRTVPLTAGCSTVEPGRKNGLRRASPTVLCLLRAELSLARLYAPLGSSLGPSDHSWMVAHEARTDYSVNLRQRRHCICGILH